MKEEAIVSNVRFTFTYSDNHIEYGGYDNAIITTSSGSFVVELSPDAESKVFAQNDNVSVIYAGTYDSVLSYTVGDESVARTMVGPRIILRSAIPVVKISAIAPEGSHTSLDGNGNVTVISEKSDYTATVYCEENKSGNNAKITTYPRVTLTLENMGEASKAVMSFSTGSTPLMYSGLSGTSSVSGQTSSYVWENGATTCIRYFGQYTTGSCSSAQRNGAGTLTSDVIVLTHGEGDSAVEYSFNLKNPITIKNPTIP